MAVTIYQALQYIESQICTLPSESIPIETAINRIASQTLHAAITLPTFNNSAMDGYGLCGEAKRYRIIGKILAGDSHTYTLHEGECIKILTGARVPESVERIIPQENTKESTKEIEIVKPVPMGANIRHRGEDINESEVIIEKGTIIDASHIGLLASQGITHIEVYRKVRIGVFASGSELRLHYERLHDSQVYNSNTLYLLARSKELGAETRFVGKSEDSIKSLKTLVNAGLDCDVIVTSGGVSVGEADYTKVAFSELGMETIFDKVMIKPGKPTTFGRIDNTLILNLPGNPLASALNFEIFGKFLLQALSGRRQKYHHYLCTPIAQELHSPRPVANVIPGYFDGTAFTPAKKFAPGMVNVLSHCNGYIVIDPETELLQKGDVVKFLPIKWDFLREDFADFMS